VREKSQRVSITRHGQRTTGYTTWGAGVRTSGFLTELIIGNVVAVQETRTTAVRTWKKIGCFYTLTMLFSGVFGAFMIYAGKMSTGDLLFVTGAMWCPALATFATKKIFSKSVRELAWQWGDARYIWLGYLIPILYALPVYVIAWVTGLGAFNWGCLDKDRRKFRVAEFSARRNAGFVHYHHRKCWVDSEIGVRAWRRNRLARVSRSRAGQSFAISHGWDRQRIDVGGLSLSSPALCGLQRKRTGLVYVDLFHDDGFSRKHRDGVAGLTRAKSVAGGDPPRQS